MRQKFVLRLLTEEGELLGWCQHLLKAVPNREAGNTRFGPPGTKSKFRILRAGTAHFIAVHWTNVDCARKTPLMGGPVEIPESYVGGDGVSLVWTQSIWGVSGSAKCPLPPVTVGEDITVSPDPAAIGAAP